MKKSYIKPNATVVSVNGNESFLSGSYAGTKSDTTWETSFTTSSTGGNESRSKSHGIWDDEE